jgi:Big-like domain-containing protein
MSARFPSVLVAVALAVACERDTKSVGPISGVHIVSLKPASGETGVNPAANVVITFSEPMQVGTESYLALLQGDVTGSAVTGTWQWSDYRTRLTFTPAKPFAAATRYVLHLGGQLRGAAGEPLAYEHCLTEHGAQWVPGGTTPGGLMGYRRLDLGWRHPNGSYGMAFSFSTG